MNIIVIPDGAMIIVPLIEKNGHKYLSPTNFSKYDNDFDIHPDFKVNLSSETPSGVRSRFSLLTPLLNKADGAIILGKRPANYKPMYNVLNELILFSGTGCVNEHSLAVHHVRQLNIPVLELAYPTTRNDIIRLIDKVNFFLKNLKNPDSKVFNDDLNTDLKAEKGKIPLDEFKEILNNSV